MSGPFRSDCRHFRSDRPCSFHKKDGRACEGCPDHDPLAENILVIKLDALGDVLRSTVLLDGLKDSFPRARVSWLTRRACAELLVREPGVDEILAWEDPGSAWRLRAQRFDLVLSLDPSEAAASAAAGLNAARTRGFSCDALGRTVALSPEAEAWRAMGLHDGLKKANRLTYPQHLFAMAGLRLEPWMRPRLRLSPEEESEAAAWAREARAGGPPLVALAPGAGPRWRWKRWEPESYARLLDALVEQGLGRPVLFAGPDDGDLARRTLAAARRADRAVHDGPLPLRRFLARLSRCELLVCGDTLPLHAATAFGVRSVALFGPTSPQEIELYGLGEKIVTPAECRGCYLPDCEVSPSCMRLIPPEAVLAAARRQLGLAAAASGRQA